MDKRIELLKKTVRKSGDKILGWQLSEVVRTKKHPLDLVTKGDLKSEMIIVRAIKKHFPEDRILSEETTEEKGIRDFAGFLWVIDPIDGTTNYSRGKSYYAVSVGLAKNRRMLAGAVYSPVSGEFYFAQRERGAFVNKSKIRCSDVSELVGASLVTETHWKFLRKNLKLLLKLKELRKLYITGCATLAMCEVASGKTDLYVHTGLEPWDNAAGFLIASEAGAKVTNLKGERVDFYSPEAVVANPKLLKNFLEEIS